MKALLELVPWVLVASVAIWLLTVGVSHTMDQQAYREFLNVEMAYEDRTVSKEQVCEYVKSSVLAMTKSRIRKRCGWNDVQ